MTNYVKIFLLVLLFSVLNLSAFGYRSPSLVPLIISELEDGGTVFIVQGKQAISVHLDSMSLIAISLFNDKGELVYQAKPMLDNVLYTVPVTGIKSGIYRLVVLVDGDCFEFVISL